MSRQCLSVNDLVRKMAKATRTSGWDAIVSYRLDLFNAALENSINTDMMVSSFDYTANPVNVYEMDGNWKQIVHSGDWRMSFKPPTMLHFTADGAVILKMPFTATDLLNILNERHRYDSAWRKFQRGWALTIKAPVSSLSASADGLRSNDHSPGDCIDFRKWKNTQNGTMNGTMVFDLDLRDNWSLSIDYEGKTELETKHRVAKILQDSIRVFLRGSLGAIRFPLPPIHIGEEDFTSDTTYLLRPKNIAFQIYSLPEGGGLDDSLACVSAYMKTEMTNFNAVLGDLKPEFCTTGQDKLYPIPRDHTASIIINRRMLFGEPCKKSIWQPIKDTKAFTSLGDDLMEDSIDSGFQLKMKWDGNYPVRDALSYAHYTGLYIGDGSVSTGDVVKAVNEAQPTLTVFDDGKMTWEPKIKVPFNIEVNFVPYRALIVKQGNWEYTAKASKDGKFEVDGLTLKGTLNLASSDWTIAYDKGDSGITEAFVGECLKHITWPTWDCNPTRNLKRLTNFAKPGAGDVITLKRDGLRVPHDFLLLGDVSK